MKTNEISFLCVTKNDTYDNFQYNNHVNMGFIWIFIFLCERLSDFFYVDVSVNVLCVFWVHIMFVCFLKKNSIYLKYEFQTKIYSHSFIS